MCWCSGLFSTITQSDHLNQVGAHSSILETCISVFKQCRMYIRRHSKYSTAAPSSVKFSFYYLPPFLVSVPAWTVTKVSSMFFFCEFCQVANPTQQGVGICFTPPAAFRADAIRAHCRLKTMSPTEGTNRGKCHEGGRWDLWQGAKERAGGGGREASELNTS